MRDRQFVIRKFENRHVTAVEACSSLSFARHTHDEYGIGVIRAGAQRSWSGVGMVEAGRGDLITVNPGEVHDGTPIGETRSWSMLYISPQRIGAIVSDICESSHHEVEFVKPVVRERHATGRFLSAYAGFLAGDAHAGEEWLIILVAGLLRDAHNSPSIRQPALARIKERIDADPTGRHRLADLSRDAGASQFQTLRAFSRLTGFTPRAYIVQQRLDIARAMIRRGGSLADAACAAGFSDQSHFHRSFTKRYGLTPGAYAAAVR